jgi:hypothetical protein
VRNRRLRRYFTYVFGGISIAVLAVVAFTCEGARVEACPAPAAGSPQAAQLAQARSAAGFAVLYPCYLPNGQRLETVTLTGNAGRRRAELIFDGPFELAVRQSQYPPPLNPDPAGASRTEVNLFPNVRAFRSR